MDVEELEPVQQEAGADVAAKPPWGSAEEFDPERAWNLIQNLRVERDEEKTKRTDVSARLKAFEDEKLTAEQKTARDLEESKGQLSEILAENALLKAGVEHGLSSDDLALLAGLPADSIPERAAALAARLADVGGDAGGKSDFSDRPKPNLRGGSNPGETPEKTPEQIVAELYNKQ